MNQIFIKSKVKHIAKVYSGATPKTENPDFWNGDVLWITPNDLSKLKGAFFDNTERKITTLGLNSCSAHLLPKGTLVMSSRAPIGYLAIAMDSFATNQGCKSLVFDNKNDSLFFYYNFHWHIDKLKQLGEGTTFAEISKSYLEEFEIAYPSLPEQIRIAQILSQADEAIAHTEALIAKYQRIKTGLMQDLLTRGIDPQGQIRSEATHPFKDSPLGRIPEKWEVMKLNQLSKTKQYLRTGPFGSSLKISDWIEIGVPVVTIGSLGDNHINTEQLLYISKDKADYLSVYQLLEGDILFSRVADIGRAVVIQKVQEGWVMSSNFMRLRIDRHKIYPQFLYLLLSTNSVKTQIRQSSNSGGRDVINSQILNGIYFGVPSIEEQYQILSKIEQLSNHLSSQQSHLAKLQSMKRGLMQDLLSGRVRVHTPQTNEP